MILLLASGAAVCVNILINMNGVVPVLPLSYLARCTGSCRDLLAVPNASSQLEESATNNVPSSFLFLQRFDKYHERIVSSLRVGNWTS